MPNTKKKKRAKRATVKPGPRRKKAKAAAPRKRSKRKRVGEEERIAERRMKALVLRRARATYRQIGMELDVSVSTAFEDVQAELIVAEVDRGQEAGLLRTEEVDHLDGISRALWPTRGEAPAARALIAASQRRAHLLGLDTQTTGATAEEIVQMAAALVSIIQTHVRDQRILDAIADQFETALGRLAPPGPSVIEATAVHHG